MLSNALTPFCITAGSVYIIPAAERSINLAENTWSNLIKNALFLWPCFANFVLCSYSFNKNSIKRNIVHFTLIRKWPKNNLNDRKNIWQIGQMTESRFWKKNPAPEKLQKCIIKIITSSPYLEHSTPLFFKLNLLKIRDTYNLEIAKNMFQIKKKMTLHDNQIFCLATQMHKHHTQLSSKNNYLYFIPRKRTDFGKKSFSFVGP